MNKLSNVELMLLQVICEKGELSGYEINSIIEERGYREWADIGTTSVYISLQKLQKKLFVDSYLDTNKAGKGPLPKKFKLSKEGQECLYEAIVDALSKTRERDKRFDLGIAASHLIDNKEVILALGQRKTFLAKAKDILERKYELQNEKDLPINVQYLFKHPIYLIKCELEFIEDLMKEINELGDTK